jgi:hypothetical protein
MNDMTHRKAKYFFDNKTIVHISLKNKQFYNGFITEEPAFDFLIVDDRKVGKSIVFFSEVFDITAFKEVGK